MANTYIQIATSTVGSGGVADITFSSIPATYTDLLLVHSSRVNDAGNGDMVIQCNGDTSAVYSFRRLNASGTAASSDTGSLNALFGLAGLANGTSSTASTFSNSYVYIPNYTSTVAKAWSYDSVVETNAATGNNLALGVGRWNPSVQAAINAIKLRAYSGSNILQHSTATLYGIKNS